MIYATPLKCEEETHHARNEQNSSWQVKPLDLLRQGKFTRSVILVRGLQNEGNDSHYGGTEWQVEIEAPSPRHIRSKTTPYQRPGDRGNAKEGTEQASNLEAFVERDDIDDARVLRKMPVRDFGTS